MGEAVEAFLDATAHRFRAYAERLAQSVCHADRHAPLRGYLTGLVLPGGRKSVELMEGLLAPQRVRQTHQKLHHLVADAPWEDEVVLIPPLTIGHLKDLYIPSRKRFLNLGLLVSRFYC